MATTTRNWKYNIGFGEGDVSYDGASNNLDGSCLVFVDRVARRRVEREVLSTMPGRILVSNLESLQSI